MPRGVYPRRGAAWARGRITRVAATALVAAYREQVAALRAAGQPATAAGVTDRTRWRLVKRVCALRREMRRRHLLPASPREAAWLAE